MWGQAAQYMSCTDNVTVFSAANAVEEASRQVMNAADVISLLMGDLPFMS